MDALGRVPIQGLPAALPSATGGGTVASRWRTFKVRQRRPFKAYISSHWNRHVNRGVDRLKRRGWGRLGAMHRQGVPLARSVGLIGGTCRPSSEL